MTKYRATKWWWGFIQIKSSEWGGRCAREEQSKNLTTW